MVSPLPTYSLPPTTVKTWAAMECLVPLRVSSSFSIHTHTAPLWSDKISPRRTHRFPAKNGNVMIETCWSGHTAIIWIHSLFFLADAEKCRNPINNCTKNGFPCIKYWWLSQAFKRIGKTVELVDLVNCLLLSPIPKCQKKQKFEEKINLNKMDVFPILPLKKTGWWRSSIITNPSIVTAFFPLEILWMSHRDVKNSSLKGQHNRLPWLFLFFFSKFTYQVNSLLNVDTITAPPQNKNPRSPFPEKKKERQTVQST